VTAARICLILVVVCAALTLYCATAILPFSFDHDGGADDAYLMSPSTDGYLIQCVPTDLTATVAGPGLRWQYSTANWLSSRLALVERATRVTRRRSSPMLSVTVGRLEALRGHAAYRRTRLHLRPSRIWWTRGTDRRVRPRQFLAGQGNTSPGHDVSMMACWEHE
jgi:hypothetical protein